MELLGQPLSQENVFENLGPEPAPPWNVKTEAISVSKNEEDKQ